MQLVPGSWESHRPVSAVQDALKKKCHQPRLNESKTFLRFPLGKGFQVNGKEAWKLQEKTYPSGVTLLGVLQSEFMEAREMMDICL